MRPVVLIIRDGWGVNEYHEGNSVVAAKTPVIDQIRARYPHCLLNCCGEAVGLPDGYQGSSEVGHLNMGAGRIVVQELKRIDDGLSSGELFKSPKWSALIENWKNNNRQLHFFGLLQDEGVHAHQEHLFKLMKRARSEFPEGRIVVHPFLDGRDTPPRSTLEYLARLKQELAAVGNAKIGTVMGRYYGMDRVKNWKLTSEAYNCIVSCSGKRAANAEDAVKAEYENGLTPDGTPMTDEYVPCYVIGDYDGVKDGDSVMHTNYRQDRAMQLTQAFVMDDYAGERTARPKVTYLGFTRYWDEFEDYLLGAMGAGGGMENLLGEVVSRAGIRQLRLAETQKFRHVTSFFNGKSTTPSPTASSWSTTQTATWWATPAIQPPPPRPSKSLTSASARSCRASWSSTPMCSSSPTTAMPSRWWTTRPTSRRQATRSISWTASTWPRTPPACASRLSRSFRPWRPPRCSCSVCPCRRR